MKIILSQRLELRQIQTIIGGLSKSVFPEADKLLIEHGGCNIMKLLDKDPVLNLFDWRSIMDILYYKIACKKGKIACNKFYAGEGKPLRDLDWYVEHIRIRDEKRIIDLVKSLIIKQ